MISGFSMPRRLRTVERWVAHAYILARVYSTKFHPTDTILSRGTPYQNSSFTCPYCHVACCSSIHLTRVNNDLRRCWKVFHLKRFHVDAWNTVQISILDLSILKRCAPHEILSSPCMVWQVEPCGHYNFTRASIGTCDTVHHLRFHVYILTLRKS